MNIIWNQDPGLTMPTPNQWYGKIQRYNGNIHAVLTCTLLYDMLSEAHRIPCRNTVTLNISPEGKFVWKDGWYRTTKPYDFMMSLSGQIPFDIEFLYSIECAISQALSYMSKLKQEDN